MLYARVVAASNRGGDTEAVWDEFPRLFYCRIIFYFGKWGRVVVMK